LEVDLENLVPEHVPFVKAENLRLEVSKNLDKHQSFIPLYLLSEQTMADDKTKRGAADRSRINVNEECEIRYWTKELGVSAERLRELVAKHGVIVADIRQALDK
jgi:hypothetical protein